MYNLPPSGSPPFTEYTSVAGVSVLNYDDTSITMTIKFECTNIAVTPARLSEHNLRAKKNVPVLLLVHQRYDAMHITSLRHTPERLPHMWKCREDRRELRKYTEEKHRISIVIP